MRVIHSSELEEAVYELFLKANTSIAPEVQDALKKAKEREISPNAAEIISQMIENFDLAHESGLPICQDTGMAVVFLDIGQDVHIEGDYIEDAVNSGVSRAYRDGYFRKSVVGDPLERINTKDNTPAVIHTRIVPGNRIHLTVMAKGFGSENTSALKMLKPSDGLDGVLDFINSTVKKAIPNGCAPLIVGVGIGGDFEQAALNAKRALMLPVGALSEKELYRKIERDVKVAANNTGIGPMGLGGINSVLDVHVIDAPTHIAGLPVAVNICCYVDRCVEKIL